MPRILRHTPQWLERPAPGFDLFHDPANEKLTNGNAAAPVPGSARTIATRGTEVFVAVGNQLRWSDLVLQREQDYHRRRQGTVDNPDWCAYRVLQIPVHNQIRQLLVSPDKDYLAIITSHTVHVAVLPDPSLLSAKDTGPLKLKTWMVGPTAHVVDRSAIATALWQPLAYGPCLVTVTEDAVVRLWEIDIENRWSFDNPALPLDLRKLANTKSTSQDFSPSKYGTNAGFSPDHFDMEVAAACFGGQGMNDETVWAQSTLWVAMRNGDVYALCPLLPAKWSITRPQLSHLVSIIDEGSQDHSTTMQKQTSDQQQRWVDDLLQQQHVQDSDGMEGDQYVYDRPSDPGSIPALQGPFVYQPDADQIFDVTDVFAISAALPGDNSKETDDFEDEEPTASLPASVICVSASDGLVHVCLDLDGTQGRWMPHRPPKATPSDDDDTPPELLVVDSVKLCDPQGTSDCLSFSTNTISRFSAFVSHRQGVSYISPMPFLDQLANETESGADQRSDFRLKGIAQSGESQIQRLIDFTKAAEMPTVAVHVRDSDLGDFLLTASNGQPYAAKLDFSDIDLLFEGEEVEYDPADEFEGLHPDENRPSYSAPPELHANTTLPAYATNQKNGQYRQLMDTELRFAPKTVDLMMGAHRLLGGETGAVQNAVSSLFQRCERMRQELKAQLQRVQEISDKIDTVLDDDNDAPEGEEIEATTANIQRRVEEAVDRQAKLRDRFKQLRNKAGGLDGRPFSDREKLWDQEVIHLGRLVLEKKERPRQEPNDATESVFRKRTDEIASMKRDLVQRSSEYHSNGGGAEEEPTSPKKQRAKMLQVHAMLERQAALVSATAEKLEQLKQLA